MKTLLKLRRRLGEIFSMTGTDMIRSIHAHRVTIKRVFHAVMLLAFISTQVVYALPTDPQVESGTATFDVKGNTMTINASDKAVVNYAGGFNIAANETVVINLPNISSQILNRDIGGRMSTIAGMLQSNGMVILVNTQGIFVAPTAQINVGSIMLSTRDINTQDFINNNLIFKKISKDELDKLLLIAGTINASKGGLVGLMAGAIEVAKDAKIIVPCGTIMLASGEAIRLDISPDGLVSVAIDKKQAATVLDHMGNPITDAIKSNGTLEANGGTVILNAESAMDIFHKSINLDTFSQTAALTVDGKTGTVKLTADGAIENKGIINTNTLIEKGASFKTSGTVTGGVAHYDNKDGAAMIHGNIGSDQYDTGDLVVDGDILLIANNLTFGANCNPDGTRNNADDFGIFYMNPGTLIDGGAETGYSLTIKSAYANNKGVYPRLQNIDNIGTLTLAPASAPTVTYESISTATFSVDTVKTISGAKLSRTVGDGSAGNPMMIYSVSDAPGGLQYMQNNLGYSYKLANSIDASETVNWNAGAGFTPVGNSTTKFTGTFDGQDHTIAGLTINSGGDDIGLFGYTGGATISNIGLTNVSVVGGLWGVGALVGYNLASTITSSYATGSVTGNINTGGLVGWNRHSTITSSYATGSVRGTIDVGGLVGTNDYSTITSSYATANVSSDRYNIGGLVGSNDLLSTITSSYATGSVSGHDTVGGLVGSNDHATITSSYATGNIGGNFYLGGLVGYATVSTLTNNFWDTETSGRPVGSGVGNVTPDPSGVTGKTTAEMMQQSTFQPGGGSGPNDWNFTITGGGAGSGTWIMAGYPHLQVPEWSDNITNVYQLQMMALSLGASYTVANNIDASGTVNWNAGAGFAPVGNTGTKFTGTFDGQDHTIAGLTINNSGSDYMGLFGYTNGATISNIGLTNASIIGNYDVGGLVGWNSYSTISSSYSAGNVSGNDSVGGLIGFNNHSTITSSYAIGSVICDSDTGGLIGINYDSSTIISSYATGSVSGSHSVGGLVGFNVGDSTIISSYATGNVSGSDFTGGLVGYNNSSTISSSYSVGNVSGNSQVGGLVGIAIGGAVNNSFWNTETSGQATSAGGAGKTTAEMMSFATFNTAGWDISSTDSTKTWRINEGETYPYLSWAYPNGAHGISGITYSDAGTTAMAANTDIALAINGTAVSTVSTGANGFYYDLVDASVLSLNDRVLIYISGNAVKGNAVAVAGNAGMTGLDIYGDALIVKSYSSSPITYDDLVAARVDNSDIIYTADGTDFGSGDLYLGSNADITVPGGNITTGIINGMPLVTPDLTLDAGAGNIYINSVGLSSNIGLITLTGNTVHLYGDVNSAIATGQAVDINGTTILEAGDRTISSAGGDISTDGITSATGPFGITIDATTNGNLYLGQIGLIPPGTSAPKFVNLTGKEIHLYGDVATADAPGNDINMTGAVILENDVLLNTDNAVNDGNITITGTIDGAYDLSLASGDADISVTGDIGATTPLNNLTIVTANDVTFGGDIYLTGTFEQDAGTGTTTFTDGTTVDIGGDLDLGTGVSLDIGSSDVTIDGTVTNNGLITVDGGNLNVPAGSDLGNVVFVGGDATIPAGTYALLTIDGAKFTLGGNVTIGDLVITDDGIFDANGKEILIAGNWDNQGGTFTANGSTVQFNGAGASSISGDNVFYNLSCTTPGKELDFASGSTQTVTGALTLTGAADNMILLRRDGGTGTDTWAINPTGTTNVSGVDVQNSVNISDSPTAHHYLVSYGSVGNDGGNNSGWFQPAPVNNPGDLPSYEQAVTPQPPVNPGQLIPVPNSGFSSESIAISQDDLINLGNYQEQEKDYKKKLQEKRKSVSITIGAQTPVSAMPEPKPAL